MTTTRGTTFTTTKGVIDRVHNDTTDGRANAEPARTASRTRGFIHVIDIGNLTHDGEAFFRNVANFATRELDLAELAVFSDEFCTCTCGTSDLSALARFHFDVVDNGVQRDVAERNSVTHAEFGAFAGIQHVTNLDFGRGDDVAALAVLVLDQSDTSRTVRIVFDRFNGAGDACKLALEVDDTIQFLVTTTATAGGDFTGVVTAGATLDAFGERLVRLVRSDFLAVTNLLVAQRRGKRAIRLQTHDYTPSNSAIFCPALSVM